MGTSSEPGVRSLSQLGSSSGQLSGTSDKAKSGSQLELAGSQKKLNIVDQDIASSAKVASAGFREVALALDTAMEYVHLVKDREGGRLDRDKAFLLQSGHETLFFQSQFHPWKKHSVSVFTFVRKSIADHH